MTAPIEKNAPLAPQIRDQSAVKFIGLGGVGGIGRLRSIVDPIGYRVICPRRGPSERLFYSTPLGADSDVDAVAKRLAAMSLDQWSGSRPALTFS